jgi:hypothetical protein
MKKLVAVLIIMFLGIATQAQEETSVTSEGTLADFQWAVRSVNPRVGIGFADEDENTDGYTTMLLSLSDDLGWFSYSRVEIYLREGNDDPDLATYVANQDEWNLMMLWLIENTAALKENGGVMPVSEASAESFIEACGQESIEILSDMTLHFERSPYRTNSYRFFNEVSLGWQVFIYENGELEGVYTLDTLPTVPFTWALSGTGDLTVTPIGC